MNLDAELEIMESGAQTEAEQIDQETEIQDVEDTQDEIMGEDAMESDLEHAFESYMSTNEADYDGWDASEVTNAHNLADSARVLESQPDAFHLEDEHDLEDQYIEMEIEDGDIYAILVDENNVEIGFVLLDENGNEQEYYYVNENDGETIDAEGTTPAHAVRAADGEDFDLGISKEGVSQATADLNVIYKDGVEVARELKDTFGAIADNLSFLKK